MNHLSDEELAGRCAHGDRHAMDVLVSRYHTNLLDFAFRHLGDRESSADIAQVALVRAYESVGRYRPVASFKTWIYKIALNLMRDQFRQRRARRESLASEIEGEDVLASAHTNGGSSPESAIMNMELWRVVGTLPDNHRLAIILKFHHGLTYEEISEVMAAPTGTVKSWIHRALKSLRGVLEQSKSEV